MLLEKPIEAYFFARFDPVTEPDLIEPERVGVLRFGYAQGADSDNLALCCAHVLKLDEDHRLRANLVLGDPPSVRAPSFPLYQAAIQTMLKTDVVLDHYRVMCVSKGGKPHLMPLDKFEKGKLKGLQEGYDMRQPFFDELMRRVGFEGEEAPLVPYGCTLEGDEHCGFYIDPASGEPIVVKGQPLQLVQTPYGLGVSADPAMIAKYPLPKPDYSAMDDIPF